MSRVVIKKVRAERLEKRGKAGQGGVSRTVLGFAGKLPGWIDSIHWIAVGVDIPVQRLRILLISSERIALVKRRCAWVAISGAEVIHLQMGITLLPALEQT